jgi:CheY-like chemotaxis protein
VTPGQYVLLEVMDTGTGMGAEVADRAFEPFFTTKELDEGSGLGLSMIYGFARQSGGHVKIFSAENHGTCVWLCLPRADAPEAAAAPVASPSQLPRGHETILVVEDNAAVREVVITQLESLGYRAIPAEDGPAALRLLAATAGIDLLFTDLVMPNGLSGRQLAEEVVRARPGIRVLFTSGYPNWAGKQVADLGPGGPLLQKPYKKKQLAEKVRDVLDAPAAELPTGAGEPI